jgi:zona occludens toxin
MITLITGVPGVGKTALLVSMLLEVEAGRPVYCDGIPELSLPHIPCPPVSEWTETVDDPSSQDGRKLVFTFPPASIICIDECQRIYRARAASSKIPDHVAALETHRHTGVDFWLLTQKAGFVDPTVRGLVGRHIHIRETWLGRRLYEWPEIGDPESKASRDVSAKRKWKLPKKVFDKYKSSQLHVTTKRRMPWYYAMFVIALVGFVLTLGYIYHTIQSKLNPSATLAGVNAGTGVKSGAIGGAPAPVVRHVSTKDWLEDRMPRVQGMEWTAPMYDGITQALAVPHPAACIRSRVRCQCYSDQGTRLVTPEATCQSIVESGYFVPWKTKDAAGPVSVVSSPAVIAAPANVK